MRRVLIAATGLLLLASPAARAGVEVDHHREVAVYGGDWYHGVDSAEMHERFLSGDPAAATAHVTLWMDPDEPWHRSEQRPFRGLLYPPGGRLSAPWPSDPAWPLATDGLYVGIVRDDAGRACPVKVAWRVTPVRGRISYEADAGRVVTSEVRWGSGEGSVDMLDDTCRASLQAGSSPNVRLSEARWTEVKL